MCQYQNYISLTRLFQYFYHKECKWCHGRPIPFQCECLLLLYLTGFLTWLIDHKFTDMHGYFFVLKKLSSSPDFHWENKTIAHHPSIKFREIASGCNLYRFDQAASVRTKVRRSFHYAMNPWGMSLFESRQTCYLHLCIVTLIVYLSVLSELLKKDFIKIQS